MSWTEQLNGYLARNALAPHPIDMLEIESHAATAAQCIKDTDAAGLSNYMKFQAAYSAGPQMLTAAIKMEGYKPVNQAGHRIILYDMIGDLFPGAAASQVPMTRAHNRRNKAEYDIVEDVTNAQVAELIAAVKSVKEEFDLNLKKNQNQNGGPVQASAASSGAVGTCRRGHAGRAREAEEI